MSLLLGPLGIKVDAVALPFDANRNAVKPVVVEARGTDYESEAPPIVVLEVTGVLAWTEEDDVTAITAEASQSISLAWTEADDTAAITAAVSQAATLAWVEADDTLAITALTDNGLSPRAHPALHKGAKHPWIHGQEYALPYIGEIEPEIAEAVAEAVSAAVVQRSTQDVEIDTARAERELRLLLEGMQRQWADQYAQLIRLEYERREQEMEDAAIALLLFDM